MKEFISMDRAMTEINRLKDRNAKLDKLCAELWFKHDKMTAEWAELTSLTAIQAKQLTRKNRYLKKYHDTWEVAAKLLNATDAYKDKTQKECVDLIYKTAKLLKEKDE